MNRILIEKAESTVKKLKAKNLTVSTAESCTGGLVAGSITSVSGVSQIFELGITSYSCRIKNQILGVEKETLDTKGAISEETALQMAENVRRIAGSDLGVSVTGVAGPDSSEGHPVGYIFIGISGEKGSKVKLLNLENNGRDAVREAAVYNVFELIDEYIEDI